MLQGNTRIKYEKPLDDDELNSKIKHTEDDLSLPVTEVVSDAGKSKMVKVVTTFFSKKPNRDLGHGR